MKAWVGGCALVALAGCVESTMPLGFDRHDRDAALRDAGAEPRKDAAVEDAGSPSEDAYAAYLAHCAREAETWINLAAACSGTTPAELVNASGRSWELCNPSTAANILRGAVTFDVQAAEACLERVIAAGCANFDFDEGAVALCPPYAVSRGTRQEGEPCTHAECRPELSCEIPEGACTGVCRAATFTVQRLGEACASRTLDEVHCEAGTFCGPSGTSEHTCLAWPRAVGDPCRSNCPLGMYCTEQGCAVQSPVGAECAHSSVGLDSCQGATVDCDGSSTTGYRCTERRKLGESCAPGSRQCWSWFFCDQTSPGEGVCRFPLQEGERCAFRGPEAGCPLTSYCADEPYPNGVCTKLHPVGARCQHHNECDRSLCDNGICTPFLPPPPPLECP